MLLDSWLFDNGESSLPIYMIMLLHGRYHKCCRSKASRASHSYLELLCVPVDEYLKPALERLRRVNLQDRCGDRGLIFNGGNPDVIVLVRGGMPRVYIRIDVAWVPLPW